MPDHDSTVIPESSGVTGGAAPAPAPSAPRVPPIAVPAEPVRLFNREFSWIEFDRRVLAEAFDESVPLLERVKFLSITSSNLDEFLMVRVGTVRELIASGIQDRSADGLTPKQQLRGIRERITALLADMYRCFDALSAALDKAGIRIDTFNNLSKKEQAAMREYFEKHVAPVLTPLAVDPGHPFPFLAGRLLNLAVTLDSGRGGSHVAFVKVPQVLPRFIAVADAANRYIAIEDLIAVNLSAFFPGLTVRNAVPFRVIRNADITLPEDEVQDLLKSVETELQRRERKEVVWIELSDRADEELIQLLISATNVSNDDIFFTSRLPKLGDLMEIYRVAAKPALLEPAFNPRIPAQLATSEDIFSIIRKGDVLLHRPFDSYTTIVEFVQSAAHDPDVLAIKQTLYRTDSGSPIIGALADAALQGKQVTAIVELQARFDESKNIAWARRLEEAGVQVVYGLVGIKTHSKICLVIRREGSDLRRYVHLSTGNYNASTARLYTDLDLLTADDAFGDDASQFMNLLTGYSIATVQDMFDNTSPPGWEWKRFFVAPLNYHQWALRMIEREANHAKNGKPAQIIAKMNALVDPTVIEALYKANAAGVKIDLIVRGICALVPGVSGLSENIRVVSIIDRFLEHTRIFLFRNGGETEVWASSGDWMPRNFFRRIELTFPILAERLRARIENQILATYLADNVKAWKLQPDGTYRKRSAGDPRVRSQERFIEIARAEAVRVGSYEESMIKAGSYRRKAKKQRKKDKGKN